MSHHYISTSTLSTGVKISKPQLTRITQKWIVFENFNFHPFLGYPCCWMGLLIFTPIGGCIHRLATSDQRSASRHPPVMEEATGLTMPEHRGRDGKVLRVLLSGLAVASMTCPRLFQIKVDAS